jgi:hypothetical protein
MMRNAAETETSEAISACLLNCVSININVDCRKQYEMVRVGILYHIQATSTLFQYCKEIEVAFNTFWNCKYQITS